MTIGEMLIHLGFDVKDQELQKADKFSNLLEKMKEGIQSTTKGIAGVWQSSPADLSTENSRTSCWCSW